MNMRPGTIPRTEHEVHVKVAIYNKRKEMYNVSTEQRHEMPTLS